MNEFVLIVSWVNGARGVPAQKCVMVLKDSGQEDGLNQGMLVNSQELILIVVHSLIFMNFKNVMDKMQYIRPTNIEGQQ